MSRTQPRSARAPSPGAAVATAKRPAITTVGLDTLFIGGLFILIATFMLMRGIVTPSQETGAMLLVGFLLNAPHFMISYRLLYGSRERWTSHFNASVIIPALLVAYALVGVFTYQGHPAILEALFACAALLLSWHWTGQTWGMISVYSTMDGRLINNLERRLLRVNLYTLLVWHVTWVTVVVVKFFAPPDTMILFMDSAAAQVFYQRMSIVGALSPLLGISGFVLFWRRTGKLPTLRMLVPWISLHLGYVWLYIDPAAFFWVQNFMHALQYMMFPMRVEVNRAAAEPKNKGKSMVRHALLYYASAVFLGIVVLGVAPELFAMRAGQLPGQSN